MNGLRFDGFSRALVGRTPRRARLQRGDQAGLAATLVAGVTREPAAATPEHGRATGQELGDLLEDVCLRPIEVKVRQGLDGGQEYLGALALKVAAGGAIEEGYFAISDGDALPVVG